MVRWCWVNFRGRAVLLIWIKVGQGPTTLAAGAVRVAWTFFFSQLSFLSSFYLSGRLACATNPFQNEVCSIRREFTLRGTNSSKELAPIENRGQNEN